MHPIKGRVPGQVNTLRSTRSCRTAETESSSRPEKRAISFPPGRQTENSWRLLPYDIGSANAPAWFFNDRIAYWSGIEHRYGQVWTMKADGTDRKQLTTAPAPASSDNPTWSADGRKILFDTQRRRRPEIWVMNADGSDQRVLLSNLRVIPMRTSWQPVFSAESPNKTDASDGE